MYRATIRVFYPLEKGRMILRTEKNWHRDLEPSSIDRNRHCYTFQVSHKHSQISFKACIRDGTRLVWAQGTNKLALMNEPWPQDVYPYFFSGPGGTITEVLEVPSLIYGKKRRLRIYLPGGYKENILKRYPVLYMHDGKNLFFPDEAFLGHEWKIAQKVDLLDSMNLTDQTIVAGIYTENREHEYTRPGYKNYGKSLVKEVKPWIQANYRTLHGPWHTCVMGSSLGGVVSFYLGWQWPEVFGTVACLSSTFSWKDNLIDRVEEEPFMTRRNLKFYLDSGWPGDNYEVTVKMAGTLLEKGFRMGEDFFYLAYPLADHSETAWGARVHIPLQFFSGKLRRASMKTTLNRSFKRLKLKKKIRKIKELRENWEKDNIKSSIIDNETDPLPCLKSSNEMPPPSETAKKFNISRNLPPLIY